MRWEGKVASYPLNKRISRNLLYRGRGGEIRNFRETSIINY